MYQVTCAFTVIFPENHELFSSKFAGFVNFLANQDLECRLDSRGGSADRRLTTRYGSLATRSRRSAIRQIQIFPAQAIQADRVLIRPYSFAWSFLLTLRYLNDLNNALLR
jgi:hypothetical protein